MHGLQNSHVMDEEKNRQRCKYFNEYVLRYLKRRNARKRYDKALLSANSGLILGCGFARISGDFGFDICHNYASK